MSEYYEKKDCCCIAATEYSLREGSDLMAKISFIDPSVLYSLKDEDYQCINFFVVQLKCLAAQLQYFPCLFGHCCS